MITSKLSGGLGNQMFQYALGRALALKNNTQLRLDTEEYERGGGITLRYFGLSDFYINAEVIDAEPELKQSFFKRLIERFYPYFKKSVITERGYQFDPNIINAPLNCTLVGYWQSEKYFDEIKATIIKDFEFKPTVKNGLQNLESKILGSNSVSVHFRRGDYVNNNVVNLVHGLCEIEYYNRALEFLSKKSTELEIFVFSDDIEWVKANFMTNHKINFVESHKNPASDMYLMSLCKHHIIANSSFGWWGAWLGSFPGKIVIGPQKWFRSEDLNSKDILPSSWIKL